MRNLKIILRKFETTIKTVSFKIRPKSQAFNPVFIIGCGRSGTTILGTSLSKHPLICYLNERRDLWHAAFPELDIWSGKIDQPKLFATEKDFDNKRSAKLRDLFYHEQAFKSSSVLLEKLPINNFRLEFLNECFPGAKYIYLHRNGLEVAMSISKRIKNGWYGHNDIKLKLLLEYSNKFTNTSITKGEINSNFNKGLFEWGLSMEQSDTFFKKLNPEKFISLSYQDFVENTEKYLREMFDFMKLTYTAETISKIVNEIERKNDSIKKIDNEADNKLIEKLGRGFLHSTIENTYFK